MQTMVTDILEDSLRIKRRSIEAQVDGIVKGAQRVAGGLLAGRKLMLFGNGGSAADAQHIAAEFVNRFRIERPPLAALALTTDASVLTSIGNDYDFDDIFAKQILALGRPDDIALGISTSGNSPNVVAGIETARRSGMATMAMTGRGGRLLELADLTYTVDSDVTARIQETHITIGHILCELVDRILYPTGDPAR